MTAPAQTPAAPSKTGICYRILALTERDHEYLDCGPITARSSDEAIKEFIKIGARAEGTYVAVPARSWEPRKITVETKTTIKLG